MLADIMTQMEEGSTNHSIKHQEHDQIVLDSANENQI